MLPQQAQQPRQQRRAGIVAGDEHGQQLIADEAVVHAGSDQHAEQIFAAVVFFAPFFDDVVEILIDGVQGGRGVAGRRIRPEHPQPRRDVLEHLQDRRPQIVDVGREVHAEQRAHQNEQRQRRISISMSRVWPSCHAAVT